MIRELNSFDSYHDYIQEVNSDPDFFNPMLEQDEEISNYLKNAVKKPNNHVFGVFENEKLTGLFGFLILHEEKYIEEIAAVSKTKAAYDEIFDYLESRFPGFQVDFVFNPKNALLVEKLKQKNASFSTEQQKMVLFDRRLPINAEGIESLSAINKQGYLEMHTKDCYWTGEKVAETPERFNTFLAVEDGSVVGYLDITNCFDENEIFDVLVEKSHRRRGWGTKLLVRAIEANRPKRMILTVDIDNFPAISLYENMGFVKAEGQNNQTATWMIGE